MLFAKEEVFQSLVVWEGYGPEEQSWIPRSFIFRLVSFPLLDHQEAVLDGRGVMLGYLAFCSFSGESELPVTERTFAGGWANLWCHLLHT